MPRPTRALCSRSDDPLARVCAAAFRRRPHGPPPRVRTPAPEGRLTPPGTRRRPRRHARSAQLGWLSGWACPTRPCGPGPPGPNRPRRAHRPARYRGGRRAAPAAAEERRTAPGQRIPQGGERFCHERATRRGAARSEKEKPLVSGWCPRQDSNLRSRLRRPVEVVIADAFWGPTWAFYSRSVSRVGFRGLWFVPRGIPRRTSSLDNLEAFVLDEVGVVLDVDERGQLRARQQAVRAALIMGRPRPGCGYGSRPSAARTEQ